MTEPVTGEGRTKGTKRIIGVAGEEPYRPHKRTEVERRSPYPFRSGVKCPEEGDDEVESEVRGEAEAGMAQGGEALGAAALLEYLREKDAQDRQERMQAFELQKKALEQERERHRLAEERFLDRREEEEQKRREEEETRRQLDDVRRRDDRREETRVREKRELLNERFRHVQGWE